VAEPRTPLRLPWGPLLTVAGLALIVFVLYRGRPGMWSPAPWPVLAAVALAVAMTFLVLRRLVSPTWGVVGGLLLAAHPYSWRWVPPYDQALWAQALELSVLAGVVTGCRLAFMPRGTFLGWVFLLVWLTAGIALCWLILPAAGFVGIWLTGLALPVFAGLAARQRGLAERPSRWNILGAILVGVLAVSAGTLLVPQAEPYLGGVLRARPTPEQLPWETLRLTWPPPGLTQEEVRQWSWPAWWAVLPLMAWGLWCTVSRGTKQSARRLPPLAWALTLFSVLTPVAVALHAAEARDVALLPWAVLSVLLSVFCVGDTLRTLWERLRLVPPHERDEE
jgi:hypothetical protein